MIASSGPPVTIIIPAFNEEANIAGVVTDICERYPDYEVLVVDDGSNDATSALAKHAGARVIRHPYNIGNGAAVKTGIRNARGEIFVLIDGDGQHDAADIARLVSGLDRYDMVVGARGSGSVRSIHRRVANAFYNRLASYVTRFSIPDLTSGFRAIRTSLARRYLYLLPNTFSYPSTLTLSLLRSGRSVHFEPIVTKARKGKSKIRLVTDGSRFILIIVRIALLFSPLRIFMPISLALTGAAICWYIVTYVTEQRFTNMSLLLFLSSLTIFMLGMVSEQIASLRMDRTEDPAPTEEFGSTDSTDG